MMQLIKGCLKIVTFQKTNCLLDCFFNIFIVFSIYIQYMNSKNQKKEIKKGIIKNRCLYLYKFIYIHQFLDPKI